jgi:CHAD domain-containing protein
MARARPILGVTPDMPFGEFASRVIAVRADEASELLGDGSVHDRRVAIRRLRTVVEVCAPALPKRDAKRARKKLKRLFAEFGDRRDADVAIAMVRAMEPEVGEAERPGWQALLDELDAAGGETPATPALPGGLQHLAAAAASSSGGAAEKAMRRIAGKRLRRVRSRLGAEGPEAMHDLRIAAKRLRYALEVAEPVAGEDERVAVAREIQDVLGEIHDCDVLLPRVDSYVASLAAVDPRHAGAARVRTLVAARRERLVGKLAEYRPRWEAALT